jgi:hypothetical protein
MNNALEKVKPFLGTLRRFDFYPKTESEIQTRSSYGGVVTFVATFLITFLLLSEYFDYTTMETTGSLYVDTSRKPTVPIALSISFPKVKCPDVNVDVVDETSDSQLAVTKDITKYDLSERGYILGEKYCMLCVSNVWSTVKSVLHIKTNYGEECCTCQQVIQYWKSKGFPEVDARSKAGSHYLCQREKDPNNVGCQITGTVHVKKVKGNMHIALGRSSDQGHGGHGHHVHHMPFTNEELMQFDLQHTIIYLRFGDTYHGMVNPLDNWKSNKTGLLRTTHFVTVVPTEYESGSFVLDTNQYSVTSHTDVVVPGGKHWHLPGVYFRYDFSPIMAKVTRQQRYFSHFVTRSFALVGGVWVVVGLIYSCFNTAFKKMSKKKQ